MSEIFPRKAEEAAQAEQSIRITASDSVPSYSDHISDDLYSEDVSIPNYQSGLPDEDELSPLSIPEDRLPESEPLPPPFIPNPASGPLSLTLDKSLIFPNTIPATALYSLNYTLNTRGNSITLRRSVRGSTRPNGSTGKITDKDLYDISRPPMTVTNFVIKGKRKSTFPGEGTLQLKHSMRGKYWECRFKGKVVLKGRNGVWTNGEGVEVATETNEVISKKGSRKGKELDSGGKENPGLVFKEQERDIDALLVDLMVAVWCGKTWCAETYEVRSKSPSAVEGEFTKNLHRARRNLLSVFSYQSCEGRERGIDLEFRNFCWFDPKSDTTT
jgi:hypothetical protein